MQADTLEGRWKQLKGRIKEKWGQLTDDDLTAVAGRRDYLIGRIQERYGLARDKAEKEVHDFEREPQ